MLRGPKELQVSYVLASTLDHETALERVATTYDLINEDLRNTVAQLIIDELATAAAGSFAPKLGKTYLGLFVGLEPTAYLWLSISQAYGDRQVLYWIRLLLN